MSTIGKPCRILSFLLVMVALPSAASAAILAGPVVYPGNGHSYYLLTQGFWPAAEAEAISLGGHLATIRNATEDSFVFTTFAPLVAEAGNRSLLIGLNDL